MTPTPIYDILYTESEGNEMKKQESNSSYEINKKIRGDWGDIKPFTRIIPNKKKNPKIKHKGKEFNNDLT